MFQSDEALFQEYKINPSDELFQTIYDRHCQGIRAFLWRRLGPRPGRDQDVEDLLAATFSALHCARHRFDATLHKSSVRDLLYKLAAREVAAHCRYHHRQRRDARRNVSLTEHVAAKSQSTTELVNDIFRILPENEATALRLTWLEGRTCKEAAEILNCPLTTVQGRVRSALKRLREACDNS